MTPVRKRLPASGFMPLVSLIRVSMRPPTPRILARAHPYTHPLAAAGLGGWQVLPTLAQRCPPGRTMWVRPSDNFHSRRRATFRGCLRIAPEHGDSAADFAFFAAHEKWVQHSDLNRWFSGIWTGSLLF